MRRPSFNQFDKQQSAMSSRLSSLPTQNQPSSQPERYNKINDRNFEVQSQASSKFNRRTSPFNQRNNRSNMGFAGASNYGGSQLGLSGQPCRHHPDEFVNYFCFTCHCPPICSECVIHGVHQGHSVQTIRKAFPHIQEDLEQLQSQTCQKLEEL